VLAKLLQRQHLLLDQARHTGNHCGKPYGKSTCWPSYYSGSTYFLIKRVTRAIIAANPNAKLLIMQPNSNLKLLIMTQHTAEAPLKSGGPGTGAITVAGTFSRMAPSGLAAVS